MPIPNVHLQNISMDFISGLLKVNDLAFIFVIVDIFSKYVIIILASSYCHELFFKHVAKYFGVPSDIVVSEMPNLLVDFGEYYLDCWDLH